ncbi:MAG: hypothetical protein ACRC8S_13055 [Fimbriiglobus sp.]
MSQRRIWLSALALALAFPLQAADPARATPTEQRDQQKKASAAVEQTARHVTTSLRILSYQKLDPNAEQELLEDVAGSLKRLSQEEMKAVLVHLENAIKAPNESTATTEQKEAYQKHRTVVSSLRNILFKLDVLRSLEEASKRYEVAAKAEFQLSQRALRADQFQDVTRFRSQGMILAEEVEKMADTQTDLRGELSNLVKQLLNLKSKLSEEQRERLEKVDAIARSGQLISQMQQSVNTLNNKQYVQTAEQQTKIAKELQAIAIGLATPKDELTTLKEAREKVEAARKAEVELKKETQELQEKIKSALPQFSTRSRSSQSNPAAEAQRLAEKQAEVEFNTREARKELEQVSKELAAKLAPAESEMRKSSEDLRERKLDDAKQAETNAEEKLLEARKELDKKIAAAELQKSDPLTATKKAAEMIDKLIEEQKANKDLTKKNEKQPDALKPAAEAQKEIAKKTDETKKLPLPENDAVKNALDKAAEATKDAAKDLAKKDAADAQPKQENAIKALEEAKKALNDQAAMIEKRQDDIAKLEAAKEKIAELAKEEKKVADEAKNAADKANKGEPADKDKTNDLAKKQDEITPPTKDLANELKDAAPDAAKKLDEAKQDQDMAKSDLAKNDAKKGAEDAKNAEKKLNEAADAVNKKLDELKAKEIADQAALQPNKVDPMEAAKQIAKAIDEAKSASMEAKKAAEATGDKSDPMKSAAQKLAEAQKDLAAKAEKAEAGDAAKAAAEAAKALEKGDLPTALDKQQKAADALAKAADMKPGEPGQPSPAEAGDLAKQQEKIKDATEALQKSMEANAAAQAALAQAQASAPMAVKPQLEAAGKDLDKANQDLAKGEPKDAGMAQDAAAKELTNALNALNAAAQANGQQPTQPGESQQAQASKPGENGMPGEKGMQPGEKGMQPGEKGMEPGMGEPMDGKQGDGEVKNETKGEGDRQLQGANEGKATKVKGTDNAKAGNFINLQKLERDKVQQNSEAGFPAEFRELIKQYNINIKKNGKAQPATPSPAPKK